MSEHKTPFLSLTTIAWAGMIIVGVGVMVVASFMGDDATSNTFMLGSMIWIAVMVAGLILTFAIGSPSGSHDEAPPWEAVLRGYIRNRPSPPPSPPAVDSAEG